VYLTPPPKGSSWSFIKLIVSEKTRVKPSPDVYNFVLCFIVCTDDVARRRGYCDHFATMCVCVWVCMLAR